MIWPWIRKPPPPLPLEIYDPLKDWADRLIPSFPTCVQVETRHGESERAMILRDENGQWLAEVRRCDATRRIYHVREEKE